LLLPPSPASRPAQLAGGERSPPAAIPAAGGDGGGGSGREAERERVRVWKEESEREGGCR